MAIVVKPFTFSNGTVADALEVNSDFDTLYNLVNGNLDTDNLSANSVDTSELVADSVDFTKIDWGSGANQVDGTETSTWKISKNAANDLSVTHASLTGARTWTHIDASDTYVGLTSTQTLSNKTFNDLTIQEQTSGDSTLTIAPLTSGESFLLGVPAAGDRATLNLDSTPYLDFHTASPQRVAVFNEDGLDIDFRIEGLNDPNLFVIDAANDHVAINATRRFYLDGGSDTYIHESSANTLQFVTGGAVKGHIGTEFKLEAGVDMWLAATERLYLDGGGDTYIQENSANVPTMIVTGKQIVKC